MPNRQIDHDRERDLTEFVPIFAKYPGGAPAAIRQLARAADVYDAFMHLAARRIRRNNRLARSALIVGIMANVAVALLGWAVLAAR